MRERTMRTAMAERRTKNNAKNDTNRATKKKKQVENERCLYGCLFQY